MSVMAQCTWWSMKNSHRCHTCVKHLCHCCNPDYLLITLSLSSTYDQSLTVITRTNLANASLLLYFFFHHLDSVWSGIIYNFKFWQKVLFLIPEKLLTPSNDTTVITTDYGNFRQSTNQLSLNWIDCFTMETVDLASVKQNISKWSLGQSIATS